MGLDILFGNLPDKSSFLPNDYLISLHKKKDMYRNNGSSSKSQVQLMAWIDLKELNVKGTPA